MTTPPKVRLYRSSRAQSPLAEARGEAAPPVEISVRRGAKPGARAAGATRPADDDSDLFAPAAGDDGFGDLNLTNPAPKAADEAARPEKPTTEGAPASDKASQDGAAQGAAPKSDAAPDDPLLSAIEAVRAEGLTSRQLRIAARLAKHHGIEVRSDEEAVVRLRQRGIDPTHRNALNELLSAEGQALRDQGAQGSDVAVLGRTDVVRRPASEVMPKGARPPMTPPGGAQGGAISEEQRAREILRIQRDIARRRRRRSMLLLMRLFLFVFLPTLLTGYYYFAVATPLYATNSEFIIQKADGSASGSPLGGILAGAGLAGNVDSITVKSYLQSREAMQRLDDDVGFSTYYKGPDIDFIKRLPEQATLDQSYDLYEKFVKIGFDPSEGIMRMEVIAPDPKLSQDQSLALIKYAEEQVDQLSARLRTDQMEGAEKAFSNAEQAVQDAQGRVLALQQKLGVLDPRAESGVVMQRIATLENELQKKQLELGQLEANRRPNQARVEGVKGDIGRLQAALEETRALLTTDANQGTSLAAITGELEIAQADLLNRQTMLAAAAQQMELARIEANKQVRYLSIGVNPVPPSDPTYPRAFEYTLISLLIFAGIYLMLSLTVSILREQVSG